MGKRNAAPRVADMEQRLMAAARKLGLGPMGSRGLSAVMGLHIETAVTHTAALPVAVNAQCAVGRRWRASIGADETVDFSGDIQ